MTVQFQLLRIDGWREADGQSWTWNQWFNRGTVSADDLDRVAPNGKVNTRKFLALMREYFDIPAGQVAVHDDGHNYVVVLRSTHEPLYALCYGREIESRPGWVADAECQAARDVIQDNPAPVAGRATSGNMSFVGGTICTPNGDIIGKVVSVDGMPTGEPLPPVTFSIDAPGVVSRDQAEAAIKNRADAAGIAPITWPAPAPMSAEDLQRLIGDKRARIVGSQRARVLRKRGDTVRYAYDTKTGKRRFIWLMPKGQA